MATDETVYGVQSWKYFWLFVAYCIAVLIVAVFFLFYSNRILARILTFIINQYTWRQYNAYIQIDSIRVTLLGGRILFKNLRYTSNNASISIVKGHIAIKYWLFNVRDNNNDEEDKTGKDLPCRIVCNFEGLEYFIYNNIPAYDKLKDILGLSPTTTTTRNSSGTSFEQLNHDQTFSSDPSNSHTSLFERLLPIQFECTKGAVLIGNMELKTILVFQMVQANGIYSITKPRSSMDCYKSTVDFAVRKPQISLKDNVDFSQVRDMEDVAKEKDHSRYIYLIFIIH
ncbi:hypothetical protein RMCBS344292_06374 [Rhizopus microsporus]|nr:hypothetical protein RMCBS344292_06374 [Rhizopus microsporus]